MPVMDPEAQVQVGPPAYDTAADARISGSLRRSTRKQGPRPDHTEITPCYDEEDDTIRLGKRLPSDRPVPIPIAIVHRKQTKWPIRKLVPSYKTLTITQDRSAGEERILDKLTEPDTNGR